MPAHVVVLDVVLLRSAVFMLGVLVMIWMYLRMMFEPFFAECLCFVGFNTFGLFEFQGLVGKIGTKDTSSLSGDDSFRLVIHFKFNCSNCKYRWRLI